MDFTLDEALQKAMALKEKWEKEHPGKTMTEGLEDKAEELIEEFDEKKAQEYAGTVDAMKNQLASMDPSGKLAPLLKSQ